jgi:hypothetical protein
MGWFLVIGMLIVFGFGFIAMNKIDRFLDQPDVFPEAKQIINDESPYVVVFGYTELADKLTLLLRRHNLAYIQIEDESQLDKTKCYTHLFAISKNDLNNLLISSILSRFNEKCKTIAICNSIDNQNIFKQNKINYLSTENLADEDLFNRIFPAKD